MVSTHLTLDHKSQNNRNSEESQKTAPMSDHFVWPITQWVLIQIT
jgi:hypothetical protein